MSYHTAFLLLSTISALTLANVCPPSGELFVPLPDCTKYIVCDDGVENLMPCPAGLYFNPSTEICDYPSNVPECVEGTRPPPTTSTTTPTTTTESTTTTRTPETTTTPTTTPTTTTEVPDPNILTRCGDTLTANSGRIEYKFQESYEANELCSFIVRSNGNSFLSGLVFTLEAHGFNATSDPNAINIYSFDDRKLIESTHLGPPNPLTEAFIPGGIAVVVFKTKGNLGTGFKLSFRAVEAKPFTAYSGENLVYGNGTSGNLTIPFWEKPAYKTSIIVLSANHKKIDSSFTALRLTFTEENLEKLGGINVDDCGNDSIRIYAVAYDKITYKGVFCSLFTQKSTFETNGLFILVFKDFSESYWTNHQASFKWEVDRTESIYP